MIRLIVGYQKRNKCFTLTEANVPTSTKYYYEPLVKYESVEECKEAVKEIIKKEHNALNYLEKTTLDKIDKLEKNNYQEDEE